MCPYFPRPPPPLLRRRKGKIYPFLCVASLSGVGHCTFGAHFLLHCTMYVQWLPIFTCGRRPAGLLATLVVVVVVVIVVVVVVGNNFYTWAFQTAHVWF